MSALRYTPARLGAVCLALALIGACFERGDRWQDESPITPACQAGQLRCAGSALEVCEGLGANARFVLQTDCAALDKVCVAGIFECKTCVPEATFCAGLDVRVCASDGESSTVSATCDPSIGQACRGGSCQHLCTVAATEKSNVGCEYWAVDLDNAMIDATSNAAAQQFAVVISNPQPDVPVRVRVFQDDSLPGEPGAPVEIGSATLGPGGLEVIKLGPREVDGSPEGEFDTGEHTALTRNAYRIASDFPVVAYQFNPLENASVFSNDASLLIPKEALVFPGVGTAPAYVALGWPQTIAATDDPNTNFNPINPIHLRVFLTVVGTEDDTTVTVVPSARVVAGGPVPGSQPGQPINVTLSAHDVLNLESGDFAADFTGSLVYADKPVAVFVGGEASDAPAWTTLSERFCCADHLEDQLPPVRTAGKRFAVPHTPHRGDAVSAAGAAIGTIPEVEFVRVMATTEQGARITTSLPSPDDAITLTGRGDFHELAVFGDFMLESDAPVLVAQVMASQQATSVKGQGLPGGDPSLLFIPPLEQARASYVFLTPDKYAFDFVTIVAPAGATVLLDGQAVSEAICESAAADGLTSAERGGPATHLVHRCQLSFPTIDSFAVPPVIGLGTQRDGVHRIESDQPVLVLVTGFDAFVSYAYAAGTDLREIAPPQ